MQVYFYFLFLKFIYLFIYFYFLIIFLKGEGKKKKTPKFLSIQTLRFSYFSLTVVDFHPEFCHLMV